jgi:hypothetical protein
MDRHERFSSLVDRDVAWHGRLVNSYRTAGAQDTNQKGREGLGTAMSLVSVASVKFPPGCSQALCSFHEHRA